MSANPRGRLSQGRGQSRVYRKGCLPFANLHRSVAEFDPDTFASPGALLNALSLHAALFNQRAGQGWGTGG